MNYTDTFFKMPRRIIDDYEMAKIEQELNKSEVLPEDLPPISSRDTTFNLNDYRKIVGYYSMQAPGAAFNDEYTCTLVQIQYSHTVLEDILVSWSRKEFEDKLNKHVEKINANSNKDKEKV